MATKTLRVTLADILGPAGPAGRVHGEVWAVFVDGDGNPRQVRYTDGTVVVPAKPRQSLDSTGVVDFVIVPNDDATVHADDRGFGVKVGWDLTVRGDHGAKVPVKSSGVVVSVVTADASTVQFGLKAPYVPIIPGTTYMTQAASDVRYATPAAVASKVNKGSTISPDDFTGTDHAKLQAAVNYAIANGYPQIRMDRMLNITGGAPISIDKAQWYDKTVLTFVGFGGGIIKTDSGVVFTSATANTGNIAVRGLKFASTAGAGAILWDGDKLLRIKSSHCEYKDWDRIFSQTAAGRWAQSIRFHKEQIIGGSGPAITFRESYDVTIDDCEFEDREAGVWNSDGTLTGIANRNLRITSCLFENLAGVPIMLAMCWSADIRANYFEQNGGATDPQIDLHTLAALSAQASVVLTSNQVQQKTTQKASKVGSVLVGPMRANDVLTSTGNISDGGILYQFGTITGLIFGNGDYIENAGLVTYPGQEDRYFTPGGKVTTTAARPKNPRIGADAYFDTTLGKAVWAKTAGTKASLALRFTAGATSSGNITVTIVGVPVVVAVTAGDTLTQVRDKVVAASLAFFPAWKVTASSTNVAAIDALQRGLVSGALTFSAGTTGVVSDYFGYNSAGTNPVWVDAAGTTV